MQQDKLTRYTKWILDFMYFSGMAVTVTLPFTIRFYGKYNSYFAEFYIQMVLLFAISGVLAVLILRELRKMFRTVLEDDCFVEENVVSLKRMGNYSFLISLVTLGRMTMYLTPAVLIVILVFLIAGLFSKVLSKVFERAIAYKLENDLTI